MSATVRLGMRPTKANSSPVQKSKRELATPALNAPSVTLASPIVTSVPPSPVPSAPWFPPHLTYGEARWVLNHVATETARHAGHADIIRESIDGKQSYELNDLADGNEVRDWTASAE